MYYFIMGENINSKADPFELYQFQVKAGHLITEKGQIDIKAHPVKAITKLRTEFSNIINNNKQYINHKDFRLFLKSEAGETNINEPEDWRIIYNSLVNKELIKPIL